MNLSEVDTDWVRTTLTDYIRETRAINQSGSHGGISVMTARTEPACGRAKAIERTEVVRPILDRLYPEWRTENKPSKNDEFKSERDAAQRLFARLDTQAEVERRIGTQDQSPSITASALHPIIWQAAQSQWNLGFPHEAVVAATKAVNSYLQKRLNRYDLSDKKLVQEAFSDKAPEPGKPRLRFDSITQDEARESMRQGAMNFGAGCFSAIRNPLSHLPNEDIEIDEQTALEQLAAFSLLARWIDQAEVVTAA